MEQIIKPIMLDETGQALVAAINGLKQSSSISPLDTTLSKQGFFADAKSVGDEFLKYEKNTDVVPHEGDSLIIKIGEQTNNTIYKCGVLNELHLTEVNEINKEVDIFFTTGDNVENMPILPETVNYCGDLTVGPGKKYIMSIYYGIVILEEIK